MKRFLFIMLLLPAMKGFAQTDSARYQAIRDKINEYAKQLNIGKDSTAPQNQAIPQKQISQTWLSQGKLSHNTSKGKVYTMPFDNMACLVPDSNKVTQMPCLRAVPDTRMPNAFRRIAPSNK